MRGDTAPMQWPIRNQVLYPMVGVLSGVIVSLTMVSAYLASAWVENETDLQAESMQQTLTDSRFPLTSRVLEQMAGLSRAEYVLVDQRGETIAVSDETYRQIGADHWRGLSSFAGSNLRPTTLLGSKYYHRWFPIDRRHVGGDVTTLHVLFPAKPYAAAWRRAVFPPLAVGGVALVIVVILSNVMARRVTAPLARLERHLARLSQGDFARMKVPRRRDEIRELVMAINRMAELLARYEEEVRVRERMETLSRLGSSMAHQIRNAATGCRLAIDLHRQSLSEELQSAEDLSLATEQLQRIESYLERFLQLGKEGHEEEGVGRPDGEASMFGEGFVRSCLAEVIERGARQVRPMAVHLGVDLSIKLPRRSQWVRVERDALEQALVNMLRNGIEAAAERSHVVDRAAAERDSSDAAEGGVTPVARVRVDCVERESSIELQVWDNGAGPSEEVGQRVYQPFVSDKQGGAGLGLALVAWVARSSGGSVDWYREAEETCFRLRLDTIAGDA